MGEKCLATYIVYKSAMLVRTHAYIESFLVKHKEELCTGRKNAIVNVHTCDGFME